MAAEAMHRASRREGPFVAINCAALSDDLAESQLFGHRRGAFSGAIDDREGFFVAARGGTLFLDEVAELSPAVQAKLLRALETHEVTPLGTTRAIQIDLRVVSATCRDLRSACEKGRFRPDLFQRLSGISLWLAPLRERVEDLAPLTEYFLARVGFPRCGITARALEALHLQPWPGNLRELQQQVTTAAVSARARGEGPVDLEDLDLQPADAIARAPAVEPALGEVVEALQHVGGNVSRAARRLGVHRAQIYRVLQRGGLSSDDFRRA